MGQATLGDFGAGVEEEPEPTGPDVEAVRNKLQFIISDRSSLSDLSCPWCLCDGQHFEDDGEQVGCPDCSAVIPTEADWYQRGEKIVI